MWMPYLLKSVLQSRSDSWFPTSLSFKCLSAERPYPETAQVKIRRSPRRSRLLLRNLSINQHLTHTVLLQASFLSQVCCKQAALNNFAEVCSCCNSAHLNKLSVGRQKVSATQQADLWGDRELFPCPLGLSASSELGKQSYQDSLHQPGWQPEKAPTDFRDKEAVLQLWLQGGVYQGAWEAGHMLITGIIRKIVKNYFQSFGWTVAGFSEEVLHVLYTQRQISLKIRAGNPVWASFLSLCWPPVSYFHISREPNPGWGVFVCSAVGSRLSRSNDLRQK